MISIWHQHQHLGGTVKYRYIGDQLQFLVDTAAREFDVRGWLKVLKIKANPAEIQRCEPSFQRIWRYRAIELVRPSFLRRCLARARGRRARWREVEREYISDQAPPWGATQVRLQMQGMVPVLRPGGNGLHKNPNGL